MITVCLSFLAHMIRFVRRDPIIFVPYMSLYLVLYAIQKWQDPPSLVLIILEWLVSALMIHPFVILFSASMMKLTAPATRLKKNGISWIGSLVVGSLLVQPWFILHHMHLNRLDLNAVQTLPPAAALEAMSVSMAYAIMGIIMSVITVYFYPIFFTDASSFRLNVWTVIGRSVRFFYSFKGITIGFMGYFFLISAMLTMLTLAFTPPVLRDLLLYLSQGIQKTMFHVVMFRLYIYLRLMPSRTLPKEIP